MSYITRRVKTGFEEYDNGNSGSSITIDFSESPFQVVTLTANTTITLSASGSTVQQLSLRVVQDGTGGRTVTWSSPLWPGGVSPDLSSAADAEDIFVFTYRNSAVYGSFSFEMSSFDSCNELP